ncbi:hypothetical protein [Lactiplantibacillus plantarum]|uniref:hypothetical protein n=1 Tax=Lactiplantibacillus plantarum TaxID=1590 RepID=UPI0007BB8EBF|nr:hypothetical protein [Lactiplantibacillus plantarum]KZU52346.1 hypothetical protein Nizo2802_1739 [Lactiplantibacillus plantarum]QIL57735.1 hypothetical protein EPJ55_08725 [Lactiplantibacillus plantarum]WDT52050.1 hypothetical protein MU541_06155 [Lactiplantibacillus plantarum]
MKAYKVSYHNYWGDMGKIIFADTPGKAKYQAIGSDGFDDAEFTDLGCERAEYADNHENDLQLDFDLLMIDNGWIFGLEDSRELVNKDSRNMVIKCGGVDKLLTAFEDNEVSYDYENDIFKPAEEDK